MRTSSLRWLWLYRPPAPTVRAQSIQVLNMVHAMARRGHSVTVAVDPPRDVVRPTPAEVLAFYGLEAVPGLDLVVLPRKPTLASVWFRGVVASWMLQDPERSVVYARSKRYASELLRRFGARVPLVMEVHEVDSAQARERGEDPVELRTLEETVLKSACGVVANCPGTLELLRQEHRYVPPGIAAHNATHPSRVRRPTASGQGVGYVGSVRAYKGMETLARAAARVDVPVTLIGAKPDSADATRLMELSEGKLQLRPPVPHRDVPDHLARFRALILPLSTGLFGERLTSPLKLWDYLASGVPIVGADLPSLQDAAPGAFHPYKPGSSESLAEAIHAVVEDELLRARLLAAAEVRTWDDRAQEVEAFVMKALDRV